MLERHGDYRFAGVLAPANPGKRDDGSGIRAAARELRRFGSNVERLTLKANGTGHRS
jgi:hypothetical protein